MVSSCCNASFADIRAQTEAHADHVSFQTSDCPGLRGECDQVYKLVYPLLSSKYNVCK